MHADNPGRRMTKRRQYLLEVCNVRASPLKVGLLMGSEQFVKVVADFSCCGLGRDHGGNFRSTEPLWKGIILNRWTQKKNQRLRDFRLKCPIPCFCNFELNPNPLKRSFADKQDKHRALIQHGLDRMLELFSILKDLLIKKAELPTKLIGDSSDKFFIR